MRDEVHLISGKMAAAAVPVPAASCTKFCEQSGWSACLLATVRSDGTSYAVGARRNGVLLLGP